MAFPFKKLSYRYGRQHLDRYFGRYPLYSYGKGDLFERYPAGYGFTFLAERLEDMAVEYRIDGMAFFCTDTRFQDIFDRITPYRTASHRVFDNGTNQEIPLEKAKELAGYFYKGYLSGMQYFAEEATSLAMVATAEGKLSFLEDMGNELLGLFNYDGETVPEWVALFGKLQAYLICCAHLFLDIKTAALYNEKFETGNIRKKAGNRLVPNAGPEPGASPKRQTENTVDSLAEKTIPSRITYTALEKDILFIWEAYLSITPAVKESTSILTAQQILQSFFTVRSGSRESITLHPRDFDHGIRSVNLFLGAARICYEVNLKGKGKQEGTLKDYESLIQYLFPREYASRSIANRMRDQKDNFLETLKRQDAEKYSRLQKILDSYR